MGIDTKGPPALPGEVWRERRGDTWIAIASQGDDVSTWAGVAWESGEFSGWCEVPRGESAERVLRAYTIANIAAERARADDLATIVEEHTRERDAFLSLLSAMGLRTGAHDLCGALKGALALAEDWTREAEREACAARARVAVEFYGDDPQAVGVVVGLGLSISPKCLRGRDGEMTAGPCGCDVCKAIRARIERRLADEARSGR